MLFAVWFHSYGWLSGSATGVICAMQLLDRMIEDSVKDREAIADSPG